MRYRTYSINLRQFAKRAQITFGAIAKGNLLPLAMCLKKASRLSLIALRKLFLGYFGHFKLLIQD
jgi:hypothetical protein